LTERGIEAVGANALNPLHHFRWRGLGDGGAVPVHEGWLWDRLLSHRSAQPQPAMRVGGPVFPALEPDQQLAPEDVEGQERDQSEGGGEGVGHLGGLPDAHAAVTIIPVHTRSAVVVLTCINECEPSKRTIRRTAAAQRRAGVDAGVRGELFGDGAAEAGAGVHARRDGDPGERAKREPRVPAATVPEATGDHPSADAGGGAIPAVAADADGQGAAAVGHAAARSASSVMAARTFRMVPVSGSFPP